MSPADENGVDVSQQLQELTTAVAALRTEVRRNAGAALPPDDSSGWVDERPAASHAWVSSVTAPRSTSVRIPRLPLELLFLAGAAVLAGVADLSPEKIAGVMAVAWVIVALAEWAGSRGDRLRAQTYLTPLTLQPPAPISPQPDPTWFTPPVEHTLLARADDQATAIAKLPPLEDPETTVERRPGS